LCCPRRRLSWISVATGIVAGTMRTDAVGDGLDEAGAAAGARPVDRIFDDSVESEHVVTVRPERRHAESQAFDGNAARGGLAGKRRGNGPLVVLANEHTGALNTAAKFSPD